MLIYIIFSTTIIFSILATFLITKFKYKKKYMSTIGNYKMQLFHKTNSYDAFKIMNDLIITYISIDLNNLKYVTDNSLFTDEDIDDLTTKTYLKIKRHLNDMYLQSLSTYIKTEHLEEFIIERIYNAYIDIVRKHNKITTDKLNS